MSREELHTMSGVSVSWIRQLEEGKERPSAEVAKKLRAALEQCPVHRELGIKCDHKLPVPSDDDLYTKRKLMPVDTDKTKPAS